jgi:cation diffusion facilitator CzcD-associated flavoprotein CzcO
MADAAQQPGTARELDIVIVGAGFAGMYLVHKLRKQGFSVRAFEAGSNVGGTWYWNRYPGCRVDIVSMEYSYQFSDELQQEWDWSEKYATQPELLTYANHVADRFDLRKDIQFHTRVTGANYDEDLGRWAVTTDQGDRVSAQYLVLATGTLSTTNLPPFPGIDNYTGATYHTGQWPHEPVDFRGQRVAVIGTGSSGCQSIPLIAEQAERLTVFQRTPNYVIPAYNEALSAEQVQAIKQHYGEHRDLNKTFPFAFFFETTDKSALEVSDEEREREFEASWKRGGLMFLGTFNDLLTNDESNALAKEFFRRKLLETVPDPTTAAQLMPDFALGCKRLIVGTDYYETYDRANVELVTIKETPIERLTADGIVVGDQEYPVDAIVFATGFDAISGSILAIDIKGKGGLSMREKWAEGPLSYLGLMTEGFPNLFTITGPGSPSVLSNVLKSIEQHVDFIADCVGGLRERDLTVIEPEAEAERAWMQHVDDIASETVFKSCDSWYLGANIPGKPRVFSTYVGWPEYTEELDEIVADNYRGFTINTAPGEK